MGPCSLRSPDLTVGQGQGVSNARGGASCPDAVKPVGQGGADRARITPTRLAEQAAEHHRFRPGQADQRCPRGTPPQP